jgi:hypothetical protein
VRDKSSFYAHSQFGRTVQYMLSNQKVEVDIVFDVQCTVESVWD